MIVASSQPIHKDSFKTAKAEGGPIEIVATWAPLNSLILKAVSIAYKS